MIDIIVLIVRHLFQYVQCNIQPKYKWKKVGFTAEIPCL